jgi:hypothetical protein
MTYLILDTNIWIYLANGFDSSKNIHHEDVHIGLIQILIEKLDSGDIQLLTNDIIISEWDRNKAAKETYIDKLNNQITTNLNYFKSIEKNLDGRHRKMLHEIHAEYEKSVLEKIAKSKFHIDQVEEILKKRSIILTVADKVIKEVSALALNKKAPFHHNKNCVADAQILFSAVDYLQDKIDGLQYNAIFITNNKEEFCISSKDYRLHPDLTDLFDSVGLKFETHLGSALKLSQKFSDDLQDILNEINKNSILCQSVFCKGYDDFIGSVVILNDEIEYLRNDEIPYDPNQLSLDIGDQNKPKPQDKRVLLSGECAICNVAHVICPDCETIIVVDEIEEFYCPTCGLCFQQIEFCNRQILKLVD